MVDLRRLRAPASLLAFCASAACASMPSTPAPAAVPTPTSLSPTAVATFAELLQLEDLRDFRGPILDEAASSPDPAIRARAALAAGRIGTPAGRDLVLRLLQDPDSSVLAAAAFSAGQIGDSVAVPALAALLDSTTAATMPTVAVEAAEALGKIGTAGALANLTAFLTSADPADVGLQPVVGAVLIAAGRAGAGAASTGPFERWLSSDDAEIRWQAAYALTHDLNPDAVEPLLEHRSDPEPLVRAFALRGLVFPAVDASPLAPEAVVQAIITAIADSAYQVRIEAIRALGSYRTPPAVSALRDVIVAGVGPHEVLAALEALGRMGTSGASAAPAVEALANDVAQEPFLRGTAVTTLAALDPARGQQVLERFSHDPEWRVRAAVAQALAGKGTDALPLLEELARDADPRVAAAGIDGAVDAAGIDAIAQLRPLLLESLASPDVQVRAAALHGFSWLADVSTYPALLDAYEVAREDEVDDAAVAAIDAIAELGLVGMPAPERAFFARFDRPDDYRQRQRAFARFREAARDAWGDVGPIETRSTPDDYLRYVTSWRAPAPSERSLPRVRIMTEEGAIDVLLFGDDAPLTVANFLDLARSGFFDGQEWARTVPNFVVQGGDPRGDMSGGPGYTIRDEPNRHRFLTGSVGMALSGADTGGSQFFITHSPQPDLDGDYTVFGRVIAGMDVAERLLPGQRILSVREIEQTN